MPDEMVVRFCAPTLASIKTGSLMNCRASTRAELYGSLRSLNQRLRDSGVRLIPLLYGKGRGLIYVYRPAMLKQDLADKGVTALLQRYGYEAGTPDRYVAQLIRRFGTSDEFPHEIGVFLGYPLEDVEGFIRAPQEARYSGMWKVYGDIEAARKKFENYRQCTNTYLKCMQNGWNIEQLSVKA